MEPADEHWYVDDEIALLTRAYNNGTFTVLPPVMGTDIEAIGGSELWGRLKEYQEQRRSMFFPPARVFVPVNLGNRHWIALNLTFDPSNRDAPPAIEYFDSLAHSMDDDVLTALLKIFPAMTDVATPARPVQEDGHNCGPWIIEWFRSLLAGSTLDARRDMRAARADHSRAPGMAELRGRLQREEEVRAKKELERREREEMNRLRLPLGFGDRAWFTPVKSGTVSSPTGTPFAFFDSRKKCQLCDRPLELDKYATGHDWFSNSAFNSFICGYCANGVRDQIKPCAKCMRLYWRTAASESCADCSMVERYQALTALPERSGAVLSVPEHHAGKLAELLFAQYIARQAGLEAITVSSQHGIDLLIVTRGNDDYNRLMTCMNGSSGSSVTPLPTSSRPRRGSTVMEVERGVVIHCFELKVNEAQFSAAQKDPEKFVESRLKRALKGEYGEEAQKGAQQVEGFMRRGPDWAFHRINVLMPRYGSKEYLAGRPILAVRYNWGGSGNQGGAPQTIEARCNTLTYMDSGWIGDIGEAHAIDYLRSLGFDLRGAVQNSVGNGIDLVARIDGPPTAPKWAFFEIKTSTVKFETRLSEDEGEQWRFVMDRINKALLERSNYVNLRNSNIGSMMVANELWWDFKSPEDWRDKALYFHLMVRLPAPGARGAISFKLISWGRPRSETKSLTKKPIENPFAVFFSPPPSSSSPSPFSLLPSFSSSSSSAGPPRPAPTGITPLTMLEHPRGGRFFPRSCEVPKCHCIRFAPSFLDRRICTNCGHEHPS